MNRIAGKIFGKVFFALGFRPFYLLAGIFACLALPLWLAVYTGAVQWDGYLRGVSWHSHEMVFGFAAAVMAGFLLTAVRNWTGQPTPGGARLGALVVLWVLARILNFTGPATAAVLLDVAFLPLLGVTIAIPIWRSHNVRNFKILLVLAALSLLNIGYHLSYMNVLPADFMRPALIGALDVFTLLMAIVGGRVIPAFTANAVASAQPRQIKSVEIAALGTLVIILVVDIVAYWYTPTALIGFVLLALAALAHAIRLGLWQPHRSRHIPLLWMLPLAYGWIPVSLALRALAQITALPPTAAVHALTLGAISGLMLAMMTRSALGHTGRSLTAGWSEISAFVLVQLAAIIRVGAVWVPAEFYRGAVIFSGVLWALAFALFSLRYWPILTRPRIDGRAG